MIISFTVAAPGLMPEPSWAIVQIFLSLVVAFVVLVLVLRVVDAVFVSDHSALICTLVGATVALALIVTAVVLAVGAGDADLKAKDKWLTDTQLWASERYGIDAGLETFSDEYGQAIDSTSECPTQANCYVSDALIDGSIVSVKLVYVGKQAMLVAGDATEMRELAVVND